MKENIEDIMNNLDAFVQTRASGTYVLPPPLTSDNTAIQQDRNEIMEFVKVLLNLDKLDNILEIGFGPYGGTHFLWRMLFNKVCTVEWDSNKVRNKSFETDDRSIFVFGDALAQETRNKVVAQMPMVDVLFCDGNHTYEGVKKEREMYFSLVRPGGIIAYHDSNQDYGVKEYLADLENGVIDGTKHKIERLHFSHVGLAFEKVL